MEDNIIRTDQNQQIKYLKALQMKKKREESGKFVVEGIRFLEEALKSDCLDKVFFTSKVYVNPRINDFILTCQDRNIPFYEVEEKVFDKVAETVNSQGIIGIGSQPVWTEEDLFKGQSFVLLIDGIQDPGNLGTILRTCYGAGIGGVIISKGTVDIYNPKVLRSTMGAIFTLPILKWEDDFELIENFKRKGYQVVAADIDTEISYYNLNLDNPTLLIVGSEAKGPREEILQLADLKAKLPMPGQAESLNVAVATGILVFEALRQRK